MTKKFVHFVHAMDLTPGKNLVWDFLDCRICYEASKYKMSYLDRVMGKEAPKFILCDRCSEEIESLKKESEDKTAA